MLILVRSDELPWLSFGSLGCSARSRCSRGRCSVRQARRSRLLGPAGLVGAAVLAGVLAGCAVGPDYERPKIASPKSYTAQPLPALTASAAVAGGAAQRFVMGRDIPFAWWTQFGSAKLDALVERALATNPTITAAQAALRQSQEAVAAQRGYYFPTVSAEFTPQRQKLAGNLGGNSPGLQGNGSSIATFQHPQGPPYNGPVTYNLYTAQLVVGYSADIFGGNRRQIESLQAQAEAARWQMAATYITLAGNVVTTAIQAAALQVQIDATERYVAQNQSALDIVRAQVRLGYAMGLDLANQELALAQAQAQLPPLKKQWALMVDLLRALCGTTPDADLDLNIDFGSLVLPADLPLMLPSTLLEQRPDVRAAEAQMHAASAQVGVAVAARLPQFTISGADGGVASKINQMFQTGGPFWSLGGDVLQPVFAGFTLQHRQRAAEQALLQAQALYRSAVLTALQNLADTLQTIVADAAGLAAAAAAEHAAKLSLEVTQTQQRAGSVNLLTLLAAQEGYEQARSALVQAQANRYGDTAALFQALGGTWWSRHQPAPSAAAAALPDD